MEAAETDSGGKQVNSGQNEDFVESMFNAIKSQIV